MLKHPMAQTITLLIIAEQRQHTTFEYAIYEVLNRYMELKAWPDEMKADLYAQLAEKFKPGEPLVILETVVSACLYDTEQRFNQ